MFRQVMFYFLPLVLLLLIVGCSPNQRVTRASDAVPKVPSNFDIAKSLVGQLANHPTHIDLYAQMYDYPLKEIKIPNFDRVLHNPNANTERNLSREDKLLKLVLNKVEEGEVYPEAISIKNDLWVIKLLNRNDRFFHVKVIEIPKWKRSVSG